MPRLGFGTAGLGAQTGQAVAWALEAGYGLIDSAQVSFVSDDQYPSCRTQKLMLNCRLCLGRGSDKRASIVISLLCTIGRWEEGHRKWHDHR